MLSRSQSRAHAAIDKIKQDNPAAQVKFIQFDLTSIESCKKAAAEFLSKENRLDILINNAGIVRCFQLPLLASLNVRHAIMFPDDDTIRAQCGRHRATSLQRYRPLCFDNATSPDLKVDRSTP